MKRIVTALATLMVCGAAQLAGQGALKPFRQATKPEEINVVVSAVVKELSYEIASAFGQSKLQPWRIEVPDTTVLAWRQVRDGLYASLHGRPVKESDRAFQSVWIKSAIVRGDSLFATFTFSSDWYCAPSPTLETPAGGGWTGVSSEILLASVRVGGSWSPPTRTLGLSVDGWCVHRSGA